MLHNVILSLFLLKNISLAHAHEETSCRTSSHEELAREKDFYQKLPPLDNALIMNELSENSCYARTLQKLQEDSLQKVNELQNNREFQEIVADLQSKVSSPSNNFNNLKTTNQAELLIFVSFSMGEKALLNLAFDVKRFGATLVLKGFKDGSYKKTAHTLQHIILKTDQGVLIDPELYSLFEVSAVPTFILTKPFQLRSEERTQTPIHDKLQGHVSTPYALEVFAKEGDLKEEARSLLSKGDRP